MRSDFHRQWGRWRRSSAPHVFPIVGALTRWLAILVSLEKLSAPGQTAFDYLLRPVVWGA